MSSLKKIRNNPLGIFLIIFFVFLILFIITYFLKSKATCFNTGKKIPIYSVDTKEKKVAITFDANWGEDNTEEILKILDKYNVKATFFLVGKWIDDYPEKAEEIFKRGHELGNHSNTHADLTKVSKGRITQEIHLCDSKIMKITGELPKLFRCPSGAYNDLAVNTVE
ncbi:polysaccharide deacetylase family protein [Haloimpatiens lingqiaonensis]